MVTLFNSYSFDENCYLVEMALNVAPDDVAFDEILVPEEGMGPDDWQTVLAEQFLNADGTERICDLYDLPEEDTAPSRFVFFLYRDGSEKLVCPYGTYSLTDPQPLPQRLADIVEFESDEDEFDA